MKCIDCQERTAVYAGFCCFCEKQRSKDLNNYWDTNLEVLNRCRVSAGLKPLKKMPKVSIN